MARWLSLSCFDGTYIGILLHIQYDYISSYMSFGAGSGYWRIPPSLKWFFSLFWAVKWLGESETLTDPFRYPYARGEGTVGWKIDAWRMKENLILIACLSTFGLRARESWPVYLTVVFTRKSLSVLLDCPSCPCLFSFPMSSQV